MLVCKFVLSASGCKTGRECPMLHPVDIDLARREVDEKHNYILCRAYACDARCDKADCTYLHVSGALGPALDLPKPQRGDSRGGAPNATPRKPQKNNTRAPRDAPSDSRKGGPPRDSQTETRKGGPPRTRHDQNQRGPREPQRDQRRPREEGKYSLKDSVRDLNNDTYGISMKLGQTRGKLRQYTEAYEYVQKYANLTKNKEAVARAAEMETFFQELMHGLQGLNDALDRQIRRFDENAGDIIPAQETPEPSMPALEMAEPASATPVVHPVKPEVATQQEAPVKPEVAEPREVPVKAEAAGPAATPAAKMAVPAKAPAKPAQKAAVKPPKAAAAPAAPAGELSMDDMLSALAD